MAQHNRTAIYPGSFNPPTIAHLAVSEAARSQRSIDRVVWSVSRVPLAKETVTHPRFEHRVAVLENVAAGLDWLEIAVTDAQLLVDIASGFDLLIMGADKWVQINQPHWYGGESGRDQAIAALPEVAVAPRPPHATPGQLALDVREEHHGVSSSRARAGAHELMLPEARAFAESSGAWLAPATYERWVATS